MLAGTVVAAVAVAAAFVTDVFVLLLLSFVIAVALVASVVVVAFLLSFLLCHWKIIIDCFVSVMSLDFRLPSHIAQFRTYALVGSCWITWLVPGW